MVSSPFVSVILPVFNRADTVARAIESVLDQSYESWELLVVDDGSTDGTRAVLERYAARLTLLSQANAGAYAARNLALERARGELIAFVDSDDVWHRDRLAVQLPLLARPQVGLVFGNAALVEPADGGGRPLGTTFFDLAPPSRGDVRAALACENFICQSSVLVRRACFDRVGRFSLSSRTSADYAKWCQIALHVEMDFVPTCVVDYAVDPASLSRAPLRSYFAPVALFREMLDPAAAPATRAHLERQAVFFEWNQSLFLIREGARGLARAARGPAPERSTPARVPRRGGVGGVLAQNLRRRLRRRPWST